MQDLKEWQATLAVLDSWKDAFENWQENCNINLSNFIKDFLEHTHIEFTEIQ